MVVWSGDPLISTACCEALPRILSWTCPRISKAGNPRLSAQFHDMTADLSTPVCMCIYIYVHWKSLYVMHDYARLGHTHECGLAWNTKCKDCKYGIEKKGQWPYPGCVNSDTFSRLAGSVCKVYCGSSQQFFIFVRRDSGYAHTYVDVYVEVVPIISLCNSMQYHTIICAPLWKNIPLG